MTNCLCVVWSHWFEPGQWLKWRCAIIRTWYYYCVSAFFLLLLVPVYISLSDRARCVDWRYLISTAVFFCLASGSRRGILFFADIKSSRNQRQVGILMLFNAQRWWGWLRFAFLRRRGNKNMPAISACSHVHMCIDESTSISNCVY